MQKKDGLLGVSSASPPQPGTCGGCKEWQQPWTRLLVALAAVSGLLLILRIRDQRQMALAFEPMPLVSAAETGAVSPETLRTAGNARMDSRAIRPDRTGGRNGSSAQTEYDHPGAQPVPRAQTLAQRAATAFQQLGVFVNPADLAAVLSQKVPPRTGLHRALIGGAEKGHDGPAEREGAGPAGARHVDSDAGSASAGSSPGVFLFVGILSGRDYRERRRAVREAWADRAQARTLCLQADVSVVCRC